MLGAVLSLRPQIQFFFCPSSLPAMVCRETRLMHSSGDCPLPSLGLPSFLNSLANQILQKGQKYFDRAQISTRFVQLDS